MPTTYPSPGVYQNEQFLRPSVPLTTGIPGFIGLVDRWEESGTLPTVVELKRPEELEYSLRPSPYGYLAPAVRGFFENGGDRCYIVPVDFSLSDAAGLSRRENFVQALLQSLMVMESVDEVDVVAIPDVAASPMRHSGKPEISPFLTLADIQRVQRSLIRHCQEQGDRVALIDALPDGLTETVMAQRQTLIADYLSTSPMNAALYYPWVVNEEGEVVPPCGHVAGVIARSDRTRGVFKAPANEVLRDVQDVQVSVPPAIQNQLNPAGINCLRAFPGRGIRLWGARTLSQNPAWRYLNTRRLVLTLERWIERNMAWATFEPNSPRLWIRIQRELTAYLTTLWRSGALQGTSANQAFFVKCDAETNPPEQRAVGQVRTDIGLAIAAPAEFLIVQITQRPNETEVI